MQHRIVNFKYAEFAGICPKNMFMISKKKSKKGHMQKKNVISSSADPRTRRLPTSKFHLSI